MNICVFAGKVGDGRKLEALSVKDAVGMLLCAADKIIENKPYLTEVDSAVGDGDHGIGMAGGMQKVKQALGGMDGGQDVYAVFAAAGRAMLMSMGGASGVIFGSMFMGGAKGAPPKAQLSGGEFAAMMAGALAAIKQRGKAEVGDKTMVDAFQPAVEALKANESAGFLPMLKAAEAAAAAGLEATKAYVAKFGRAKSLMQRAVGHQDAGATSVYIIFGAMREYVQKNTVQGGTV